MYVCIYNFKNNVIVTNKTMLHVDIPTTTKYTR